MQRCLPKKERMRVLRRCSGETSGGISRASDGHVDDEGDNFRGALAVFACEVRYPKQATVSRSCDFFYIFKKIKISKIYVRFEKFRKYTPVARGATGP